MASSHTATLSRRSLPTQFSSTARYGLGGERKGRCLVRRGPSAGHSARVRNCRCRKRAGVWRRPVLVVGLALRSEDGAVVPAAHLARHCIVLQSGANGEREEKGVRRRGSRIVGSL